MTQTVDTAATSENIPRVAFYAALAFLAATAVAIHWLGEDGSIRLQWPLLSLSALWLLIISLTAWEFVHGDVRNGIALHSLALVTLIPALRLALSPGRPGWIWLPGLGWRKHGKALFRVLERTFAAPMLLIAGLMLPILAIEIFWESATTDTVVRQVLSLGTATIWVAFTAEFIIMISVADARLKYCISHWLDLVIILLPLVSYLRVFRLIKLGKIARTLRAYRIRSVTTKAFRGVVTADLIGRLLRRSPEKQVAHLQQQVELHEEEAEELRRRIAELQKKSSKPKGLAIRNLMIEGKEEHMCSGEEANVYYAQNPPEKHGSR
jgi:voltage-gated potassium channel